MRPELAGNLQRPPISTSSIDEEPGTSMTTGNSCSRRGMQSSSPNLPRSYAGVPRSLSAPTSTRTMRRPRHFRPRPSSATTKPSNPTGLPPSDGCFPLLQDFV